MILAGIMIFVQGALALVALVALIFLIVKRLEDKQRETFEKRDN
ncbi:MAG: hypothetical protein AAGB22_09440 [Bacteroidota bacterium]